MPKETLQNRWSEVAPNVEKSTSDRFRFSLYDGVMIEVYIENGELVARKSDQGATGEGSMIIMPSVSNQVYIK